MRRPTLVARPSDPVIISREIDVYFIIIWSLLFAAGLLTAMQGLPSLQAAAGVNYGVFWSAGVALTSLGAAISGTLIFFKTRLSQPSKKRLERGFCWAMMGFIAFYPIALIADGRLGSAFFVAVIFMLPFGRARHLTKRIKLYGR